MLGSVRVLLKPISHSTDTDFHFVAGATLSLSRGGSGKSQVTSTAQPASLVFTLGLIKSVRPPADREDQPLATLSGQFGAAGRFHAAVHRRRRGSAER